VIDKRKQIVKVLKKSPFILVGAAYLVLSLSIPWLNSAVYIYLKMFLNEWFSRLSILITYFILFGTMKFVNHVTTNKNSFKKEVSKRFFSPHSLFKSAVIYIIAVAFLASENQTFGIALLIPYYMYVINFYTSVFSGEIKEGWF